MFFFTEMNMGRVFFQLWHCQMLMKPTAERKLGQFGNNDHIDIYLLLN